MKSLTFFFLLVLLFFPSKSIAQMQRAATWYFGYNAGIDFRSYEPVPLVDGKLISVLSSASISDFDGNLLFYCDDYRVYNRNHSIMTNGTGLDGYNSNTSQTIIIIPRPKHDERYFILTLGEDDRGILKIHEVDLSDHLGNVISKNKIAHNKRMVMKLNAVNHSNGEDVWVLVQGHGQGKYYAFLITENGISSNPVISDFNRGGIEDWDYGQIKFSPNGSKVALANKNTKKNVVLYDFDNSSGLLTNEVEIAYQQSHEPEALEFSPNSNFLYVASRDGYCYPGTSYLYQYDILKWNENDIKNSRVLIKSSKKNYGFLQMAINGKIYMGGRTSDCDPVTSIHSINQPNLKGIDCNFDEDAFNLGGKTAWNGLPNFNQSYFNDIGPPILEDPAPICEGDSIELDIGRFRSYIWSTWDTTQSIFVKDEGWYSVTVKNNMGWQYSDSVFLTVNKSPIISLPDSIKTYSLDSVILDAGEFSSYTWNTSETTQSISVSNEGWYTVRVTNFTGCQSIDSVFVLENRNTAENCEIIVPNVFTPNADGINDTFEMSAKSEVSIFNLQVYNRTGKLVYQTNELSDFWDGTMNGEQIPNGVYYWLVDIKCSQDYLVSGNLYKGWVQILK